MLDQDPRSLLERLEAHRQGGYLSLHMPGHKENTALAPYLAQLGAQWDITELPGFDDLHDPAGILAQAMDRAARLWGSRKSWLQVNGSTGGLLAAVRAATRRGDTGPGGPALPQGHLPTPWRCAGWSPVFLLAPVVEGLGIAGSLTPDAGGPGPGGPPRGEAGGLPQPHLRRGGQRHGGDLCQAAHAQGVPVLVDEAHGAHLGLHPAFPPNAMALGADLAVASLHKTLPSLTQTAVLHASGQAGAPAPGGPADGDLPVQLPLLPADGLHGRLPAACWRTGGRPSAPPGPGGWRTLTGRSRACGTSAARATGRQAGEALPGVFAWDPRQDPHLHPGTAP